MVIEAANVVLDFVYQFETPLEDENKIAFYLSPSVNFFLLIICTQNTFLCNLKICTLKYFFKKKRIEL